MKSRDKSAPPAPPPTPRPRGPWPPLTKKNAATNTTQRRTHAPHYNPRFNASRNLNLCNFPVEVFGNSETNSTHRGRLYPPTRDPTHSRNSTTSPSPSENPAFKTTKAATLVNPPSSSRATTAASKTAG